MDLQLKDLLISIFFEGALSFLWIGVLVVAWRGTAGFVEDPLKAMASGIGGLWRKTRGSVSGDGSDSEGISVLYVIIPVIIALYPIGAIMHRVSDEFAETTARWMPEPGKEVKEYASCGLGADWCGEIGRCARRMFGSEPFGSDNDIKGAVMDKYRPFIEKDYPLTDRLIRNSRRYRAFGNEKTRPYMNTLLELVRISQAALMHSFLLAFVLFFLALLILLGRLNGFRPDRMRTEDTMWSYLGARSRWLLARLLSVSLLFLLLAWIFSIAPRIHDCDEYNYPVLLVFMIVVFPLIFIGGKILFRPENMASEPCGGTSESGPDGNPPNGRDPSPVLQLLVACAVSLIFCYWSTFAWAEHRENYWEAVLVLGEAPSESSQSLSITLPLSETDQTTPE